MGFSTVYCYYRNMLRMRKYAAFLLFLCFLGILNAQEMGTDLRMTVAARIEGTQGEDTNKYRELFIKSLRIELKNEGIQLTDETDPDVLIFYSYDLNGDKISFHIEAQAPEGGTVIFSSSEDEELRFELDTVLLEHAARLSAALVAYREVRPQILALMAEDRSGAKVADNLIETRTDQEIEPASADQSPSPVNPAKIHAPEKPWMFSADVGVYMPGGEGGRYLKSGYAPAVFAGYRLSSKITVGMGLETMFFRADGYATEANGYVISFGPGLRLRADNSGNFVPGFRANISGALFIVAPGDAENELKVVPSLETGITLDYMLGGVKFNTAIDMTVFFDGRAFLVGFTPRVGLVF